MFYMRIERFQRSKQKKGANDTQSQILNTKRARFTRKISPITFFGFGKFLLYDKIASRTLIRKTCCFTISTEPRLPGI